MADKSRKRRRVTAAACASPATLTSQHSDHGSQGWSRIFPALSASFANRPFPRFQKPCEQGVFSVDEQRQFVGDASQRKVYVPPASLPLDLREGYPDRYDAKDEDERLGLEHLLRWIDAHGFRDPSKTLASAGTKSARDGGPATSSRPPIATWRGHLTKMLCTLYDRKPWRFSACLHEGIVYLSEWETQSAVQERQERDARQREMCFWGYRFEGYCCQSPQPATLVDKEPARINSTCGFCSVVTTKLGNNTLLFAGEVDCSASGSGHEYLELKTSALLDSVRRKRSFLRYKTIKWWAQSFLLGVDKIICGLRDEAGKVRKIETYTTGQLARMVKGRQDLWNPAACMSFLEALLNWLVAAVLEHPNDTLVLEFDAPFENVTLRKDCAGQYPVLPSWFTATTL